MCSSVAGYWRLAVWVSAKHLTLQARRGGEKGRSWIQETQDSPLLGLWVFELRKRRTMRSNPRSRMHHLRILAVLWDLEDDRLTIVTMEMVIGSPKIASLEVKHFDLW